MKYTKDEVIALLEKNNLVIPVKDNKYVLNTILVKHFKVDTRSKKCINYPKEFLGLSDSIIYKKVMKMCNIPFKRKGLNGAPYLVRTTTDKAIAGVKKILQTPNVDFDIFIATTKNFYESDITVSGFAKYIYSNNWELRYEEGLDTTASERDRKGTI